MRMISGESLDILAAPVLLMYPEQKQASKTLNTVLSLCIATCLTGTGSCVLICFRFYFSSFIFNIFCYGFMQYIMLASLQLSSIHCGFGISV